MCLGIALSKNIDVVERANRLIAQIERRYDSLIHQLKRLQGTPHSSPKIIDLRPMRSPIDDEEGVHHRQVANRRNAQRSTGPRTRSGKHRVRKNALKHGLAAGPLAQKYPKHQVEALVDSILGPDAGDSQRAAAQEFALAHLYWQRVISFQKKALKLKLNELQRSNNSGSLHIDTLVESDPELQRLRRYEKRAFNRRLKAARTLALSVA